jgi:Zn-dependent protease
MGCTGIARRSLLGAGLLPAFPLDGGRVLRSLLWRHNHDLARSTSTAATVGKMFGYLMMAFGLLELFAGYAGGVWLALVGLFIVAAAGAQAVGTSLQGRHGRPRRRSTRP